MTWNRALLGPSIILAALVSTPSVGEELIYPQTIPIALDAADPGETRIGELSYRGGVVIEPGDEEIGGISGLEW